jgi:cation diffusion facilitator family transporter
MDAGAEAYMHTDDLSAWQHHHEFDSGNAAGQSSTRIVMWITAVMMAAEIGSGWWFNSMALLADGFHMSSHAVAIGLSAFAYAAARRHASDARYAFGTWKIEVLGGFASAIFLLVVVALMVLGSIERLFSPTPIHYEEAMLVAAAGLAVNIFSAYLLGKAHHHGHEHDTHHHGHERGHQHHDLNLRSAYVHVMADAATSILAILALAGGWRYGWSWLDPVMGLVGATVVVLWAKRLIADTSMVLLDREMDHPVVEEIREVVERGGRVDEARIADLHVWRVAKGSYACALSVVTHDKALTAAKVRQWISEHEEVVHATIEIHVCPGTQEVEPAKAVVQT